jgi:2-phospho-L-lactate guanylyltransferase (CobY/MobA/RfbA family)
VITLVPDRHDDGTNLMSFPIATPLLAAYGQGSFRRHLIQAMSLGVGVQVVRDSLMALDLDHPSDLDHPLVKELLPAWLRTNPVNPPPTS